MSGFLFEKKVDQSLLKAGLTIPVELQDIIQDAVGLRLNKGDRANITIVLEGKQYKAILTNINFSEESTDRVVFQIRYSEGSPLCQKLKELFSFVDLSKPDVQTGSIEIYAGDDHTLEFKVKNAMREAFFNYLGKVDSLAGYQRSYKLVFYKVFFERLRKGQDTSCDSVTSDFRQYYVHRKEAGLIPDIDADTCITNIEQSTIPQIRNLILRNPFNAISSHGFMTITDQDAFELELELKEQLSSVDIEKIIDTVEQKLKLYYSSIDNREGHMKEIIEKILNEYVPAKQEPFAGHPLGSFFRNDIPRLIYETGIVRSENYLITGSVGQGNWAMVPWVCIFDRRITTSATKGVYIVYLLEKNGESIYLTLNQGCTDIRQTHSKRETIRIMREKAAKVASRIDPWEFNTDENIFLGEGLTELGELYQKGTIFYKEYKKGAVPDDGELNGDLINMLRIYQEYVSWFELDATQETMYNSKDGGEEGLTIKDTVESIKKYIAAKGFTYQDGLIENFYLSMKSKPFVILAGTSGTGKTRLVKLFAEAVGATTANGRYKMVSVRPDWSDSTDLFGHVDLNGAFVPGVIIDFVKQASVDNEHPYFLCLDEMNLARVEYYMSDFLSVIETRDLKEEKIVTDPLVSDSYYGSDLESANRYGSISFPENLYVIGTVNMDETTFPFSRKVLDRANTIEFSFVDLTPPTEWAVAEPESLEIDNGFLKTKYLLLAQCADQQEAVNTYCAELKKMNDILQQANAHVGYRVRDEIVFYMLNNKEANLLSENDAMDNEILQKVLPRIQGSSASIKKMLCDLFKVCAGDYEGQQTESDLASKMEKVAERPDCKYKKSAKKIAFMVRRYEEDGFTSYWL